MSIKCIDAVYQTIAVSGSEFLLLLAVADCASDQWSNIRPSVPYLAWKANVSERTVQNFIDKWISTGALKPVGAWDWKADERRPLQLTDDGKPKGGRGIVTVYRLDLSKFPTKKSWDEHRGFRLRKGAKFSPFSDPAPDQPETVKGANYDKKGCNLQQERVQNDPSHNKEVSSEDPSEDPSGFKTAAADAAAGAAPLFPDSQPNKKKQKPEHPELEKCCAAVYEDYTAANQDVKLDYVKGYRVPVKALLRKIPDLTTDKLSKWLLNRRMTPGVVHCEEPAAYLRSILRYKDGPLTEFNKAPTIGQPRTAGRSGQDREDTTFRNINDVFAGFAEVARA